MENTYDHDMARAETIIREGNAMVQRGLDAKRAARDRRDEYVRVCVDEDGKEAAALARTLGVSRQLVYVWLARGRSAHAAR